MKKQHKILFIGMAVLTLSGMIHLGFVDVANACGYGQSGGGDYVPQRRDGQGFLAQKQSLSAEQARDIVTSYVKRLNPNLAIGKITDNGNFYEVEVVAESNEIIQVLGVDKQSGRLIMVN